MSKGLLLDTCTAIWLLEAAPMKQEIIELIDEVAESDEVHISPITAWEVGTLVSRSRLILATPVMTWFDRLVSLPGTKLADMPPKVLVDSTALPGKPPSDPADCILAATAREYGFSLVTRDRVLLKYADAGHLNAIVC